MVIVLHEVVVPLQLHAPAGQLAWSLASLALINDIIKGINQVCQVLPGENVPMSTTACCSVTTEGNMHSPSLTMQRRP